MADNWRADYRTLDPEGFDRVEYLARYDTRLFNVTEGRTTIGRYDPLAWAMIYLPHWFTSPETGHVTMSRFHLDLFHHSLSWVGPQEPMGNRHAWLAPRGGGKSTLLFRCLPMWALAYEHRRYCAVFTKASTLAEEHLNTFRQELRSNHLLRHDFPKFTRGKRGPSAIGHDNSGGFQAETGVVITARGMDSSVLGASIGGMRADLIQLDDVEPDESNYSIYQKTKRLRTITGAIMPYNYNAVINIVGTTTMTDGIMHDLARTVSGKPGDHTDPALAWVHENKITTHHYPALYTDPNTGEEKSLWPQRWSVSALKAIPAREFAMQMQNDPSSETGGMWEASDFTHISAPTPDVSRCILMIDPSMSQTDGSDYTGIAVAQFPHPTRDDLTRQHPGHVEIIHSSRVRLTGRALADHVQKLLHHYPHVKRIVIEKNAGGIMWRDIFGHLPIPVELIHSTKSKEARAAAALTHYQARPTRVKHLTGLDQLEKEMRAYPNVTFDDQTDAANLAVLYWLEPQQTRLPGAHKTRQLPVSIRLAA